MKNAATHLIASVVSALISGSLAAAPNAPIKTAQLSADDKKQETSLAAITYKAPLRGAPATRVGGGTRSAAARTFALSALAPNETGYTTRDKPTIYWYVSEALQKPVELTIISNESLEAAAKPALELTLQPPVAGGVHAISLEEHGLALKPGVEYQWFVAIVNDTAQRSNDIIAGGTIKRVAETDSVRSSLKSAPAASRPALYAAEGIWYDAVDELSRQIRAEPANRRLHEQRAALLEQVGLTEAAAFDRSSLR